MTDETVYPAGPGGRGAIRGYSTKGRADDEVVTKGGKTAAEVRAQRKENLARGRSNRGRKRKSERKVRDEIRDLFFDMGGKDWIRSLEDERLKANLISKVVERDLDQEQSRSELEWWLDHLEKVEQARDEGSGEG